MKTIIIADDHPMTLNGIQLYVENLGFNVINTYQNGIDAYQGIINLKPDVVVLDLNMPGMNGLEVLEKIRVTDDDVKIILYTMYHEKSFLIKETLIIKKHDTEMTKLLSLTAAERKILSLIGKDNDTKKIAELLFISDKTVEKHRSNIIKKLGLPNERNVLQRFALLNQITE